MKNQLHKRLNKTKFKKMRIKLEKITIFFFTKESRPKIRNQKNKNLSGNLYKLEDNSESLHGQHKF